ncbi:glycosyltransferase family 2 protein [Cellulomonas gilvus]|uniref:4,4'-diaponeurosporenoate glycosyltransferase n=1 Tax=Cellulomonas gilvus (strain ATCC 13127 / NRRL B-14078) TaxID=593907 RepID=F8A172_CELGA|nr:glycosyltransferase family 2 protein [Cellulomonas gilvus]AEI11619.1 glycosyl transferase family 2 [Cellulomonas gilvus ATCC 13127]
MIPEPAPAVPDQGEAALPPVSVIMPVRDEEPYLADSVHRILDDGYAGEIEIVLAVGPSQDRTAQIADELAARDPRVVVVENPTGRTPAGLNAAIRASRHAILVRVDGHGFLPPRYIETAVDALARTGAANVGGVMVPEGRTPFEQAVARAMSSRVGIGGAPFHVGGQAGPTQSVYLGVFRRDVLEELGGFDEHFTRAQDWELNHRIRAAGHTVWFEPGMRVAYRPRSGLRALVTQFRGSGRWRREVVRTYPETASMRYLAAPVAVVGLAGGTLAGVAGLVGGPAWLRLGFAAPVGYAAILAAATVVEGKGLAPRARAWFPGVVATMHLAWGAGFLAGVRAEHADRAPR